MAEQKNMTASELVDWANAHKSGETTVSFSRSPSGSAVTVTKREVKKL